MLTRMLVPKPKKAFQSPAVHIFGRNPAVAVAVVIAHSPPWQIPKKPAAMPKRVTPACLGPAFRELENPRLPAAIFAIVNDRCPKIRKARANRLRAASRCRLNREGHETAVKLELNVRGPPATGGHCATIIGYGRRPNNGHRPVKKSAPASTPKRGGPAHRLPSVALCRSSFGKPAATFPDQLSALLPAN